MRTFIDQFRLFRALFLKFRWRQAGKAAVLLALFCTPLCAQSLRVENLKVDHLSHADLKVVGGYPTVGHESGPGQQTVIANARPVFGWEMVTSRTTSWQTDYRIMVSRDREKLVRGARDAWDSGRVTSRDSVNVMYDGAPLKPNTTYYWRVMIWGEEGEQSEWSDISKFVTADVLEDYKTSVYPLQKTDEIATTITKTDGVTFLDFGRASFGQLKLTLSSKATSETVVVRLGEAVDATGRINRKPGGTIRFAEYPVALRKGKHTYSLQFTPDKRNTGPQAIKMPDYIGEVMPFRYCELEGYGGKLAAGDIIRATVHYPFDDSAAHFESSNPTLNAVWELCKYSIKATSFAGIYVDGDRERIPYEADAYINQLSHYGVDKEYSMARRSHEYLLHNATWPTEWILQSVLMAYNDYLYTGDIRSARHHYDDLKAKLLLPLRDENGLISTRKDKQTTALLESIHFKGKEPRDIVDWPHTGSFGMEGNGETDGFVFTDYNAVVNAFHYKALRDMEVMASKLGKGKDREQFNTRAWNTYDAFQRLLWDDEKKVYRDGVGTDHAALHTNMMAMAFGLVPDDRKSDVMKFIKSRGMACSVYGSQFLMDAIYDAGDEEYGLSLLASESDRSWFNMIRAGSTISMEAWDNKYKPNQDWNHAWGAVPANVIPRKLMGIEPLAPGWEEISVRPQIADLEWAEIRVPTIRGDVQLSCRQDATASTYTLTVPANATAFIALPAKEDSSAEVKVGGHSIAVKNDKGWLRLHPLGSGTHELVVSN